MPLEILHRAAPRRNVPVTFTLDRMFRAVLKLMVIPLLALVGEPGYLWRFTGVLLLGAGATALVYWVWAEPLSIWPGACIIVGAAIVGVAWEWKAEESEGRTLR